MADAIRVAVESQLGKTVPGVALVAVDAHGVVVSEAWGASDVASGALMTVDTACNWFSMTKLVTATVAVQLADKGLLDRDAPVLQYYQPFAGTRPEPRMRAVTVRHLMNHSSGLTNPIPLSWVHLPTGPSPDRAGWVRRLIEKHSRLGCDQGSTARYSNLGYLVLGEVIESATGERFEVTVNNLLAGLRTGHTGFVTDPGLVWATPYQRRGTLMNAVLPALVPRTILGPNHGSFRSFNHFYLDGAPYGGLVGLVSDAARFLRAHLLDGELDGARMLSERSARMMRTISAQSS
jgi:CubicO group peptidase (beta-lactamase class C family)